MSLTLECMNYRDWTYFSHLVCHSPPWMVGWTSGWANVPPVCRKHIHTLRWQASYFSWPWWFHVLSQIVACCQTWPSQWTRLGTGGSGESEMASHSLHQKPHHCCPQRRGRRTTTWLSSGSCSPTMTYSTRIGPRSPGDTLATESAPPSIPSSPSCPRISWSSFTGIQPLGWTVHTL